MSELSSFPRASLVLPSPCQIPIISTSRAPMSMSKEWFPQIFFFNLARVIWDMILGDFLKRSLLRWHWEHPWCQPVQHDYTKLPWAPRNLVEEQCAFREGTDRPGPADPLLKALCRWSSPRRAAYQNPWVECDLRARPLGTLITVFVVWVFNNNNSNPKNRSNVPRERTRIREGLWVRNLQHHDENFATCRCFL